MTGVNARVATPRQRGGAWRAAALTLLALLALKWGVVDGYEVHGNSMEPLFRDRRAGADRIAVFKRHFDLFPPRRFDLVVFDRPPRATASTSAADLAGDRFVKRLIGMPGDEILIEDGDAWLLDAAAAGGRARLERPLGVLLEMEQLVAEFDPGAPGADWSVPRGAATAGDRLVVTASSAADAPAALAYQRLVCSDWVDRDGVLHESRRVVHDSALAAEITAETADAAVALELFEGADVFRLELAAGAGLRLLRQRGPGGAPEVTEGPPAARLPVGKPVAVHFLNADDRLVATLDGEVVLELRYDGNTPVLGAPSNAPVLRVLAGTAALARVQVLRDVDFTDDGTFGTLGRPYQVPAGSYFLLGDNSANSRDSRHFGAVDQGYFIGKPFLIFHPFDRWKVL